MTQRIGTIPEIGTTVESVLAGGPVERIAALIAARDPAVCPAAEEDLEADGLSLATALVEAGLVTDLGRRVAREVLKQAERLAVQQLTDISRLADRAVTR